MSNRIIIIIRTIVAPTEEAAAVVDPTADNEICSTTIALSTAVNITATTGEVTATGEAIIEDPATATKIGEDVSSSQQL